MTIAAVRRFAGVREGAAGAVITAFAGFGALNLFWLVGDYGASGRGLYDYRSATIGDGVILPLLAFMLIFSLTRVERRGMRTAFKFGAAIGAAVGVATQLVWLLDSHPALNWTSPRAHHFNVPGWYHAVFLVAASSACGGSVLALLWEQRHAPRSVRVASEPQLAVIVGLGLCFAATLLLDEGAASTQSALASMAAITVTTLAVFFLFGWAIGARSALSVSTAAVAIGAGFAAGVARRPHINVWLALVIALVSVALAAGLNAPALWLLSRNAQLMPLVLALASASTILGSLLLASTLVARHGRAGLLVVVAGVGCGAALPLMGRSVPIAARRASAALAALFPASVLLIGAWMQVARPSRAQGSAAVQAAEGGFDLMAFALFRERFAALPTSHAAATLEDQRRADAEATEVWIELVGFGVAVIVAVIAVLAVAGGALGIDRGLRSGHHPRWEHVILAAGAAALALGALRRAPHPADDMILEKHAVRVVVAAPVAFLVAAAALTWAATPFLIATEKPHFVAEAAVGAAMYGLIIGEDLCANVFWLQRLKVTVGVLVLVVLLSAAAAAAAFWLLAYGLWSFHAPAPSADAALSMLFVLVGTWIVVGVGGTAVARGRRAPRLALSRPGQNLLQDLGLHGVLVILAGVVPLYVNARMSHPIAGSLGAISALVFVPGALGAFFWVMENNERHLEAERHECRATVVMRAKASHVDVGNLNAERIAVLERHVRFQNASAKLFLGLGAAWLVVQATS